MMRIIILMIGLLSVGFAHGQEVGKEWEIICESDGIVGYTRPISQSNVNEIMAIGNVEALVAVIEAVLRDDAARTEYSEKCTEAYRVNIPGLEASKDRYYSYHRIDMPWPLWVCSSLSSAVLLCDFFPKIRP